MRKCLFLLFAFLHLLVQAQNDLNPEVAAGKRTSIDRLQNSLRQENTDTAKASILRRLAAEYAFVNKDSSLLYYQEALTLSQNANDLTNAVQTASKMVDILAMVGNYPKAIELALHNLQLAEKSKDTLSMFWATRAVWRGYSFMGDTKIMKQYAEKVKALVHSGYFKKEKDIQYYSLVGYINALASVYKESNQLDSALYYGRLAYGTAQSLKDTVLLAVATINLGEVYSKKKDIKNVFYYYRLTIPLAQRAGREDLVAGSYFGMAKMYARAGQNDSALVSARTALQIVQPAQLPLYELGITSFLSDQYKKNNQVDSAFKYQSMTLALKDSLYNQEKTKEVEKIGFNEQQRLLRMEAAERQYHNRIIIYASLAALLVFLILAVLLYRNNLQKQKANELLQQQKGEIEIQNAKIRTEAALERVRSSAMAMHDSTDVGNAIGILFTELDQLGIIMLRCGMAIVEEGESTVELWTAMPVADGKNARVTGRVNLDINPMVKGMFKGWKNNYQFYTYELSGTELVEFYRSLAASNSYVIPAKYTEQDRQIMSAFFFKEGCMFIYTFEPLSLETRNELQKFASVLGLTYRRYLDLKKSEEQARKAVIEASLDRVRAEIASMRSAEDLRRIIPLMWRELTILKIPFVRCGVFIVDESSADVHLYLSTPKGQSLGLLNLKIDATEGIKDIVDCWRKGQVYTEHWDKERFLTWMQAMIDSGQVHSKEIYQGDPNPPQSLDLHFIPFAQGMLYVGNTERLGTEEIALVTSLAEAFSIAYARYEDFKQLEEAKRKVDKTLAELNSAQAQLIQSEKMASLGQLTAGIAHEIQNPLNFVNNFSELNTELIEELKQKATAGQVDEVLALANAIKENEQKVNHHGQRADAIVKAMLQHSRVGSSQKEKVDLNALVTEYLNLSYHGMRAKNKQFNVTLETRLDRGLSKIAVMPQDIGRVLINLFNNAFYSVIEKKSLLNGSFTPQVCVSTQLKGNKIEVHIKDNGIGIAQKWIDKIFQPFFTTKPTGEGTGLGLSLSYDIITKGHGGELKVASKEGEFAEFILTLPAS